ncbi:MAG: J domain-containing protein [Deltaproteobacteria bacterium]|nr:J domain-containing protein [Deltaproteobacteria bacterium]
MNTYQKITEARKLLELPERTTMKEIKSHYRALIRRWHPDRCGENREECTEMTRKIIAAYTIIMTYCKHYRYSFSRDEIRNYLPGDEWWVERFGGDPLWSPTGKPK